MDIKNLGKEIIEFTDGESVFLYGSQARKDKLETSDYELGVLIKNDKFVGLEKIRNKFNLENVSIFPLIYEQFKKYNPDTPFVKNIWMTELSLGAKTVAGEKVIENMKKPEISLLDIAIDVRFYLGCALSAIKSYKGGDEKTATELLTKSCLYATRDYIIVEFKKFIVGYNYIYEHSKQIDFKEYPMYKNLIEYAYEIRINSQELNSRMLYTNISYINQFVEKRALTSLNKFPNKVVF